MNELLLGLLADAERKYLPPSRELDLFKPLIKKLRCRYGDTPAKQPREVTSVPEAVFFETIEHLSRQVQAILLLCFYTGARLGEILVLTTEELDRSSDCWEYRSKHHKTSNRRKKRVILFGPKSRQILLPLLRPESPTEFLFSPAQAEGERRDRLKRSHRTDSQRGKATMIKRRKASLARQEAKGTTRVKSSRRPGIKYTSNSVYGAVKRTTKRCGIPNWHPHQLRHTRSAILKREEGEAIAAIVSGDVPTNLTAKTVLGHDSQTVTAQYGDESQAVRIAVARKYG